MKRFLPIVPAAAVLLTLALAVPHSQADIKPGHLVAGAISWDGKFAVAEIYVGGTYGQTVRGGRTAILEMSEPGKGWYTLTSLRLPDIGPKAFYLAAPLGQRKGSTTIRLRITPASAFPDKDMSTRTFPGSFSGTVVQQRFTDQAKDLLRVKGTTDLGQFQNATQGKDQSKSSVFKKLPPP